MYEDVEAQTSQDGVLELGVVIHDDGHDALSIGSALHASSHKKIKHV